MRLLVALCCVAAVESLSPPPPRSAVTPRGAPSKGAAASQSAATQLPDGRAYRIFADDTALSNFIRGRIAALAVDCIGRKGGFSVSVGSGTTVAPLKTLIDDARIDFSKFHVFFGNERTEGETAGKCFEGAAFIAECGVPAANVHRVPAGDPAKSAADYEALLRAQPEGVVGRSERSGLPALDLVLLGSGADGHTASLYPGSPQVLESRGAVCVPAAGKGGVTLTIDAIGSARLVLISAGKAAQAGMVAAALGPAGHGLPAGLISANDGTAVEWLLTEASAAQLTQRRPT